MLGIAHALLLSFLCTRAGDAGPSLFWEDRAGIVLVRSGGSPDVDTPAIDDALAWSTSQWTAIEGSDVVVTIGEPTEDRLVGFDWAAGTGSEDNKNIVIFRGDNADDPVDAWVHQLGALAITTVTYESGTGELLDADIEMNDGNFTFTACDACEIEHDLKNTLTHEVGHVLGLDHPPDEVEATMYASAAEGDTGKRDLWPDDEEGIRTIYPESDDVGNCYDGTERVPPPEVSFEPTVCGATWDPPLFAGLATLFLALSKRRQMRRPTT